MTSFTYDVIDPCDLTGFPAKCGLIRNSKNVYPSQPYPTHLPEINSSSVHTYIFVCFIRNYYYIGLLANNATWCQNRGCICISSIRRTYGRIHAVSCIHPVIQTSTRIIILWTELFPKKRREKIQGEILQRPHSSSNPRVFSSVSTCNPATTTTSLILHTELILPQENYYNYKAHPVQIVRRHPPATVPHVSKHSTWQNKGSECPTVF